MKLRNIIKGKIFFRAVALILMATAATAAVADNPKREFRGAWLHVIGQSQWQNKSTAQAQAYIRDQLDKLHDAGCNAVIFQVRPTADALYKSELEPWSAWLTGKRGKAPDPMWDPMEYAIEEAHRRGMEFHAWLNPYRVTSSDKDILPAEHGSRKEPHRFVKYDHKVLYDPAYQENRDEICKVVDDIVSRYDVDAIHIDDYFYPYPVKGKDFPDKESYAKFGNGMPLRDWRRHNVDLLIEQLNKTIKARKPWVRFGVSPFGIWRNKKSDPRGSESNGLQNYDDLYADILLWDKNGWVDYLVPQLYWELDHSAAPTRKLIRWWNDNVKNADLYIGYDVNRTMKSPDRNTGDRNELATKVRMSRELKNVKGNVWWHGYWVTGNLNGVADSLAMNHQSTIALPPAYGDKSERPETIRKIRLEKSGGKMYLKWETYDRHGAPESTDPVRFVVYEFFPGEKYDINDAQTIISLTPFKSVLVANDPADIEGATFAVTALDRMNRESEPVFLYSKKSK